MNQFSQRAVWPFSSTFLVIKPSSKEKGKEIIDHTRRERKSRTNEFPRFPPEVQAFACTSLRGNARLLADDNFKRVALTNETEQRCLWGTGCLPIGFLCQPRLTVSAKVILMNAYSKLISTSPFGDVMRWKVEDKEPGHRVTWLLPLTIEDASRSWSSRMPSCQQKEEMKPHKQSADWLLYHGAMWARYWLMKKCSLHQANLGYRSFTDRHQAPTWTDYK